MKLTIIAEPNGIHQQELIDSAKRKGLEVETIGVDSLDVSTKKVSSKLGDAVVWRSSKLDIRSERPALKSALKNKIVVSDTVFESPAVYFKYYQQQILQHEPATAKWSIPTFRFAKSDSLIKAIDEGLLKLPIIAKPNAGSRGDGILLIKELSDIKTIGKLSDFVFQSFIPNDGDWRVVIVGGAPIGVLLRQRKGDQFINNISKGASGSIELDPGTLYMVRKISSKVASLFHATFCGVDIIRNAETGEYSVLEVNTAPQWFGENGFQSITGVQVADAIVDWIIERDHVKKVGVPSAVESYYKNRIHQIPSEAFHFASRMWLWTGDSWARKQLDIMQESFIGLTDADIDARIQKIVETATNRSQGVNQKKAFRKEAFEKHDKLSLYNALLFKTVFCDSVYDLDIRPFIRKYVSDKDFIDQFNKLIDDGDSIRLMSTHAINYFYLLKNYFKDKISLSSSVLVTPGEILKLLPGYKNLEKSGIIDRERSIKLQIYLLTHAIIGASRFYARRVRAAHFITFCKKIERLIKNNYYDISLDNKLEFLVCSQICGYESTIRQAIEQEAEQSVSWAGNFLVDTLNTHTSITGNCLRISEHRNVLYLMSQHQFVRDTTKKTFRSLPELPSIGRLARIKLPDYDIRRAIARVDSGATSSSIDASNIYIRDGKLHFTLFNENNPLYTGKEFVTGDFKNAKMKNTTGHQERYAVVLKFELGNQAYDVLFALADRRKMLYPILLGRNFLKGRYTVNTARQFIEKSIKRTKGN
ncbi:MAG: RimK/LysX family protein [Candidatus Saccharibacteria bacterium]